MEQNKRNKYKKNSKFKSNSKIFCHGSSKWDGKKKKWLKKGRKEQVELWGEVGGDGE